ncbi:GNAT family N-acetyltransferase [uncultured Kingella sp.]|uniref:GNAT family N-acetyltransferase n=1 Tax=uncultured Kingella sp. TaxID=159270 RepID=UPI0025940EFD|nr:GNAT family N-acetyltransferase [uncultured Kingella sp.]
MALSNQFEPLDKAQHDIKHFRCGKPVMDEFLHRYAAKNAQLGLSKTWVLPDRQPETSKAAIAAYYTLSLLSIAPEQLNDGKSLPRYPAPVTLLARLAVASNYQGKGLGTTALLASLMQAVKASDNGLPTYAVVLDVLDEAARAFYQQFAFFKPLDAAGMRLFVPMRVLKKQFQAA